MTKQHDLAHYLDGRKWIPYCKVCSAEGDKLLEACPQKFENKLDEKNSTAK